LADEQKPQAPAKPGIQTPGEAEKPKSRDQVGQIIANRYKLVRLLGKGGMGKVFLAIDQTNGQRVAMKMLRTQYQQHKGGMERFIREVKTVRKLDHPCIVKIMDAGKDDDLLFYTMEYVEGKSLRQFMQQRKQLNFDSTVRIMALLAQALEHAHNYTIHRDLSPENVMVLQDGSIRLLDFGLAKMHEAGDGLTIVGMNLGKIKYNAPEQRSNAAAVDHRADIYPLGIMFFEMLTGTVPNRGSTLAELRPDLPKGCDTFVKRSIALNPDDRFTNCKEYYDELMVLYKDHESMKQGKPSTSGKETKAPAGKGGIGAIIQKIVDLVKGLGKKKK
jgi:serine/threonine protein kinase